MDVCFYAQTKELNQKYLKNQSLSFSLSLFLSLWVCLSHTLNDNIEPNQV